MFRNEVNPIPPQGRLFVSYAAPFLLALFNMISYVNQGGRPQRKLTTNYKTSIAHDMCVLLPLVMASEIIVANVTLELVFTMAADFK